MYECWYCGEIYKGSNKGGSIQVYDEDKNKWVYKCPNCGKDEFMDLYEEDSYDY
jgi:DNA-directed RNA polymerase subunit RPC12/RpoP